MYFLPYGDHACFLPQRNYMASLKKDCSIKSQNKNKGYFLLSQHGMWSVWPDNHLTWDYTCLNHLHWPLTWMCICHTNTDYIYSKYLNTTSISFSKKIAIFQQFSEIWVAEQARQNGGAHFVSIPDFFSLENMQVWKVQKTTKKLIKLPNRQGVKISPAADPDGVHWTPLSIPSFLNILWKWNNLVSVRPNYFIFMGYLISAKGTPYEPPFQKSCKSYELAYSDHPTYLQSQ